MLDHDLTPLYHISMGKTTLKGVEMKGAGQALKKILQEEEHLSQFVARRKENEARVKARQAREIAKRAADPVKTMWSIFVIAARRSAIEMKAHDEFWQKDEHYDLIKEIHDADRK